MGNGVSLTTSSRTAAVGIDNYVAELRDYRYEKSLGHGRFMRTIRCRPASSSTSSVDGGTSGTRTGDSTSIGGAGGASGSFSTAGHAATGSHNSVDCPAIVKVFVKADATQALGRYKRALRHEMRLLAGIPHVLPYAAVDETERAGYLVRQYLYTNLYDRISTRPFLSAYEKKWIVFQLLVAVAASHAVQVTHGDIKTENVLVTTWNCVYLADYANFKPTYLPEDNPANFYFFFDTSGRRSCYLAPERFTASVSAASAAAAAAVATAVSGAGNNAPSSSVASSYAHNIPTNASYNTSPNHVRNGSTTLLHPESEDEVASLAGDNSPWRNSTMHVPNNEHQRQTAEQLLRDQSEPSSRPMPIAPHMRTEGMSTASSPSLSDMGFGQQGTRSPFHTPRRSKHNRSQSNLYEQLSDFYSVTPAMDVFSLGCTIAEIFLEGAPLFTYSQLMQYRQNEYYPTRELQSIDDVHIRAMIAKMISLKPEERGDVSSYLSNNNGAAFPEEFYNVLRPYMTQLEDRALRPFVNHFSGSISDVRIDRMSKALPSLINSLSRHLENGLEEKKEIVPSFQVLASVTCSSLRNVIYPSSKLSALNILVQLSEGLEDEFNLDRIIPFCIQLLEDPSPVVRALACQSLASVVCGLSSLPLSESKIFADYLIPAVKHLSRDDEIFVRATYSGCIAFIAEKAITLVKSLMEDLDRQSETMPAVDKANVELNSSSLAATHAQFEELIIALLIGQDTTVKRALLLQMPALCNVFGPQKANDILLSHMITYLNEGSWQLRCDFFASIKTVGKVLGKLCLQEYILPLMVPFLTDADEPVIASVLETLASLIDDGLIGDSVIKDLSTTIIPLVCHPTVWIRYGTVGFIIAASKHLSHLDVLCVLYPLLQQFLKYDICELTDNEILENLVPPIDRELFDQILNFSRRPGLTKKTLLYLLSQIKPNIEMNRAEEQDMFVSQELLSDFLSKIQAIDISESNRLKIYALREFIVHYVFGQMKKAVPRKTDANWGVELENMDGRGAGLSLTSFGVHPHNVFLMPFQPDELTYDEIRYLSGDDDSLLTRYVSQPGEETGIFAQGSRPSLAGQTRQQSIISSSSQLQLPLLDPRRVSTTSDRGTSIIYGPVPSLSNVLMQYRQRQTAKGNRPRTYNNIVSELNDENKDPNIARLILKKTLEYFPPPIEELGPKTLAPTFASIMLNRIRGHQQGSSSGNDMAPADWVPEGISIAHLAEHTGRINQMELSLDQNFFVTCSKDKTVKVWDTQRIERNAVNHSRITYSGHDSEVLSVAFCEGTHSIASAALDGSIHISRIAYTPAAGSKMSKYGDCTPVRIMKIEDDYAVQVTHFDTESQSLLTYMTAKNSICGIDLRTMEKAWKFSLPGQFGAASALSVDQKRNFMVVGTHRGVICIFDVRFGLLVKSFAHPSGARITNIAQAPSETIDSPTVLISTDTQYNEVSLWDVNTSQCKQVWCTLPNDTNPAIEASDWTSIFGHDFQAANVPNKNDFIPEGNFNLNFPTSSNNMKAVVNSIDVNTSLNCFVTGGNDRIVRYWDYKTGKCASMYNGITKEADVLLPWESNINDVKVSYIIEPQASNGTTQDEGVTRGTPSLSPSASQAQMSTSNSRRNSHSSKQVNSGVKYDATEVKLSTLNNVIREGAYTRFYTINDASYMHKAAVTNVRLSHLPFSMIVSTSTDGVIKCWK